VNTATRARAHLYRALADAFAEPAPGWEANDSRVALAQATSRAAAVVPSPAAARAARGLAAAAATGEPPARVATMRRTEGRGVAALVHRGGRPAVPLHESLYFGEPLGGPITRGLAAVYEAVGLRVVGAELADHASVELAFLEWVTSREAEERCGDAAKGPGWRRVAQQFIRVHPGRWLPDVGRALAAAADPFFGSAGRLLADWLAEESVRGVPGGEKGRTRPATTAKAVPPSAAGSWPGGLGTAACSLCGYCARACPAGALAVRETATSTALVLDPSACTGCGACAQVCRLGCLTMIDAPRPRERLALVVSARGRCPDCGRPTVSRAELAAVADRLGYRPPWLEQCPDCRPVARGVTP